VELGEVEECKVYNKFKLSFIMTWMYEARPQSKFPTRPTASTLRIRDRAMM
jgi:hypothetical protein